MNSDKWKDCFCLLAAALFFLKSAELLQAGADYTFELHERERERERESTVMGGYAGLNFEHLESNKMKFPLR